VPFSGQQAEQPSRDLAESAAAQLSDVGRRPSHRLLSRGYELDGCQYRRAEDGVEWRSRKSAEDRPLGEVAGASGRSDHPGHLGAGLVELTARPPTQ